MNAKQKQKKNNKGFSMVELIVVIAIMAVLVGVLSPVLIRNVEKSRETKDLQSLDAVKGVVESLVADDKYYTSMVNKTFTITNGTDVLDGAIEAAKTEFQETTGQVKLSSKKAAAAGNKIQVAVGDNGKVIVRVVASGATESTTPVKGTFMMFSTDADERAKFTETSSTPSTP